MSKIRSMLGRLTMGSLCYLSEAEPGPGWTTPGLSKRNSEKVLIRCWQFSSSPTPISVLDLSSFFYNSSNTLLVSSSSLQSYIQRKHHNITSTSTRLPSSDLQQLLLDSLVDLGLIWSFDVLCLFELNKHVYLWSLTPAFWMVVSILTTVFFHHQENTFSVIPSGCLPRPLNVVMFLRMYKLLARADVCAISMMALFFQPNDSLLHLRSGPHVECNSGQLPNANLTLTTNSRPFICLICHGVLR